MRKHLELGSMIRGVYRRVAIKCEVDPSYVSRVARGERKSATVEKALIREYTRILVRNGKQTQKRAAQER